MAWIESHQSIGKHPKTLRVTRLLGISVPELVGHMHLLWHWCLDFAEDGDVTEFDAEDLAVAAMYEGDAEAFVDALVNCGPGKSAGYLEWQDDRLVIRDWDDYAGKLIARREANRDRMRRARAEQSDDTDDVSSHKEEDTSKPRAANVQCTSSARVEPPTNQPTNQPKPTETNKNTGAAARRAREPDPLFEAVVQVCYDVPHEMLTDDERGRVNKALPQLRKLKATTGQVEQRATEYRARSPEFPLTPQALTKSWNDLGKSRPRASPSKNGNATYDPAGDWLRWAEESDEEIDTGSGHGPVIDITPAEEPR